MSLRTVESNFMTTKHIYDDLTQQEIERSITDMIIDLNDCNNRNTESWLTNELLELIAYYRTRFDIYE